MVEDVQEFTEHRSNALALLKEVRWGAEVLDAWNWLFRNLDQSRLP